MMHFSKVTSIFALAVTAALGAAGCVAEGEDPTEDSTAESTEEALSPEEATATAEEALSANDCGWSNCYGSRYDNDHYWRDYRSYRWYDGGRWHDRYDCDNRDCDRDYRRYHRNRHHDNGRRGWDNDRRNWDHDRGRDRDRDHW